MAEQFTLAVSSDRPSDQLQSFVGSLARDLGRVDGIDVQTRERAPQPGERSGAAGILGELLVQIVAGGAINALIGVLKTYIERDRTVRFKITANDGRTIEVNAKDLDVKGLPETLRELQKLSS